MKRKRLLNSSLDIGFQMSHHTHYLHANGIYFLRLKICQFSIVLLPIPPVVEKGM